MPEWWPAVVFGWPAVVMAVLVAAAGIVLRRPVLLVVSALVAAPFGYYLSGAESWVAPAGLFLPFALVGGAYAVKRCLLLLAWALWIPVVGAVLWLGVVVLNQ